MAFLRGQGVSDPRHKRGTSSWPGRVRLSARGCQPPAATRLRLAPPLAGGSEGGQERIEPGGAAPSWSDKEAEGVGHPGHKPPLSFPKTPMSFLCTLTAYRAKKLDSK